MAQMTQSKKNLVGCNTNSKPTKKARNWCFTLNNYTKRNVAQMKQLKLDSRTKQFCFQEEKSESGTLHLQGVIAFNNAISFNSVKKINDKAHWEPCRNLKRSLAYCSKEQTRHGETYTYNFTFHKKMDCIYYLDWLRRQHEENSVGLLDDVIGL